jgi:uncharacterized protein DUF2849
MPTFLRSQVVTASDLLEGDVIYLTDDDTWTRQLSQAELITDEAHGQLRLIDAQRQKNTVVGAYLADVSPGQPGPVAAHFREEFRATGPSNYAHGKQEGAHNV